MNVLPAQIRMTQAIGVYFSAVLPDAFRTMSYRNNGFGIARCMLMTANNITIHIYMSSGMQNIARHKHRHISLRMLNYVSDVL